MTENPTHTVRQTGDEAPAASSKKSNAAIATALLTATAKTRCLREWQHVDDPPCHPEYVDWNGCYACVHRKGVAETLRVLVKEVLIEQRPKVKDFDEYSLGHDYAYIELTNRLLKIADEVEAQ